jgi:hypothetical protein
MRTLIAALLLCAAAVAPGQQPAGAKNTPAPRPALPQTWQNAPRGFAALTMETDIPAGANARILVAPPQTQFLTARNEGAMPIPGQWPDLKKQPIPTTWPKLKLLLVEKSVTQPPPAPKK